MEFQIERYSKQLNQVLNEMKNKEAVNLQTKEKNTKKIISFIEKNMSNTSFKETFIYDIWRDPDRTVNDYFIRRHILLNLFDVNNVMQEDFTLQTEKYLKDDIDLLNLKTISLQSWIEHLTYVKDIQKVNKKEEVIALIDKRIAEKKKIWSSGNYTIWLCSAQEALEWAKSAI